MGHLEDLGRYDCPTIANALELADPTWDRVSGIMAPRIHAVFPDLPMIVGYACTVLYETRRPARTPWYADWPDYWAYVKRAPGPRIAVCQNTSARPGEGSLWGEVQANIHRALGCVGAVVEGSVRDLDGMRGIGFPCFAREVVIGHGRAHIVEFGHPVEVGDVVVQSGDLVCADKHGVIVVPARHVPVLAGLCRKIVEAERPLIAACTDPGFSIRKLKAAFDRFSSEYPVDKPGAV